MSEHEHMPGEEVHDLGSNPFSQVEMFAQIAEIEEKLKDPTLRPEQIRSLKDDLEIARDSYKNLK